MERRTSGRAAWSLVAPFVLRASRQRLVSSQDEERRRLERNIHDGVGRYPHEAEAAAYFCVLEALQNAAKYAEASRVELRLSREGGNLVFTVTDDGRGFDPATTPPGSGLQNMADRLEALGGNVEVSSTPGRGTMVSGRIPVVGGSP